MIHVIDKQIEIPEKKVRKEFQFKEKMLKCWSYVVCYLTCIEILYVDVIDLILWNCKKPKSVVIRVSFWNLWLYKLNLMNV